jgi:hypothetical protein
LNILLLLGLRTHVMSRDDDILCRKAVESILHFSFNFLVLDRVKLFLLIVGGIIALHLGFSLVDGWM